MSRINKLKQDIKQQLPTSELLALVNELTGPSFVHTKDSELLIKNAIINSGVIDELSQHVLYEITRFLTNRNEHPLVFTPKINSTSNVTHPKNITKDNTLIMPNLSPSITIDITSGYNFNIGKDSMDTIEIHLSILGHRYSFSDIPSSTEPQFNIQWTIPMKNYNIKSFIENNALMHIVVLRIDSLNSRSVIGTSFLEVRKFLGLSISHPINDIDDHQIVTGLIDIKISHNFIKSGTIEQILSNISKNEILQSEKYKWFVDYTKKWWSDFIQIRSSHQSRLVKLYVNTENGKKEPVTNMIQPIRSKLIKTPRHAARYVSLIPFEKSADFGLLNDLWYETDTFLSLGKGDLAQHTLLLCSLLLGFCLNAYVTLGLNEKNESHMWVTIVGLKGETSFWDAITGQIFVIKKHPYKTIGCCFNHESFYANIQPSDSADVCKFKFDNANEWKKLSKDALSSVCRIPIPFNLQEHALLHSIKNTENEIESELKYLIASFRDDHSLGCVWDEDLSFLTFQQLWKLEMDKLMPEQRSEDEFKLGVLKAIPNGQTFKGFPMQFLHVNSSRIFHILHKTKACRDILITKGENVRFGICCSVVPYAESGIAVWIMVSVGYNEL